MSTGIPEMMRGAMLVGPEQIVIDRVPVPQPASGELLLAVRAATTCGTDVKVFVRGGHPRMLKVPTLFGHEMAGEVAALGAGVNQFSIGDRVVVANSAPCGTCRPCRAERQNLCTDLHYLNGAYADYVLVPERFVATNTYKLPADMSFARAALTEPLACVMHGASACELEWRANTGDLEAIIFGAGPIGLLFVAVLARQGHRVVLADPNQSRLKIGQTMGATQTILIGREGGEAQRIRALSADGVGLDIAIDCTGSPIVWSDAIGAVRPGGLVNFFGGCAPGTNIRLDTHLVHYSELTLKGVYHHRPASVRAALTLLNEPDFPADPLLSDTKPIEQTEAALRSMMNKQTLKVVIDPAL